MLCKILDLNDANSGHSEEGARFPMTAVSSGVWAEAIPLETAWNLAEVSPGKDGKRKTMRQELERIGYLGSEGIISRVPVRGTF